MFGSLANIGTASPLDLLNTAIKGANLVRNAQNISKAGIQQEASGLLTTVLGNVSATPSSVVNPDGTISRVPTSTRVANGASQTVSGVQQVVSPAGINLPSIGGSINQVSAVAKIFL